METNNMPFLFAAYAAIWIILGLYLYSIRSREKRLQSEIEWLKAKLEKK